ncbi:hypothetical protein [Streptomyces sp. PTY087I2]|uniref:hypothetical protein n=1 Tax=Streptomyces sp. PTY087I2 TaxID=1819298 RepID=UPI00080BFA3B|nr:hypothetical protein [Streptomyces sp. PTY087I2]OCC09542.1 hypothetical protein A3Q37_04584 [Streptomyces sp. PTY087I2]
MSELISSDTGKPHRKNDLRNLGFEPGTVVVDQRCGFTLDDLKTALFSSTYRDPKTLPVALPEGRTVKVAVSLAEPRYAVDLMTMDDDDYHGPVAFYPYPDWYIEGWVDDGIATATAQGLRVRMYVYYGGDRPDDSDLVEMYAQIIPTSGTTEGDIFCV